MRFDVLTVLSKTMVKNLLDILRTQSDSYQIRTGSKADSYRIACGFVAASERLISRLRVSIRFSVCIRLPMTIRLLAGSPRTPAAALSGPASAGSPGGFGVCLSDCWSVSDCPWQSAYGCLSGQSACSWAGSGADEPTPAFSCSAAAGARRGAAAQLWRVDLCAVRGLRGGIVNVADFREGALFVVLL